jgi:NADPH:quinone reductase-like Zn-dependent oxidoreductase
MPCTLKPGEQKAMDAGLRSSYPWIPGADLCGTVVAIGSAVKQFNIGDRIISLQMSPGNLSGCLQDFAVAEADLSTKVPDHYTAVEASTLPVVLLTNFAAFYTMKWEFPFETDEKNDEPILVWGGGSGVGQAAISLLKLSGYTNIITTASIKREEYLASRGAKLVVDYKDSECLAQIKQYLADRPLMKAIDTISSVESSNSIMQLLGPGAQLAYVLPGSNLAKRAGVQSQFVMCGMFHDVSSMFHV